MELQIFNSPEFGQVRTVEIDSKTYFVATDIAKALGYAIPSKAVNTHCKGVSKMEVPTNGGIQEMLIIPEGDIYRLIVKSQLDGAEKFERWVFDDVLPSIRKNGMYAKDELLDNPDLLLDVVARLKQEKDARLAVEKQLEVQAPKIEAYNTLMDSKQALYIGDVAKLLNSKEWGQKRLFVFLRNAGVLTKDNLPYQEYINKQYFRVVTRTYTVHDEIRNSMTTLVMPKGIDYILNLIKGGVK